MKNTLSLNFLLISIFSLSILVSSCRNDDETTDCDTYEWEYIAPADPETWQLCSADCGGQEQSPINITGVVSDNNLSVLVTD